MLHNPVVAKQDKESPLMANIRLDNVLMPEAKKLTLKGAAQVLAESASGDPLYAMVDRTGAQGSSKLAVLTVDLDKSDLPLQTVFPIMMTNLLNWYGGTKGELRESLAAGAAARVELPATADATTPRSLVLRSPDGVEQTLTVPAGASKATVGPLDRCGVWTVRMASADAKAGKTGSQAESVPEHRRLLSFSPSCRATWPTAARATCGRPRACRSSRRTLRPGWRSGRSGTISLRRRGF